MRPPLPTSVTRARLQLMLRHPYLASACARFPLSVASAEEGIGTMATDGYRIYVNPEFTERLQEEEVLGVLAHELMHNVLGHLDRQGQRDPELWNQAIDHATNLMLEDLDFTLPNPKLCNGEFSGMSAEEIYRILQSRSPRNGRASNWDQHLLLGGEPGPGGLVERSGGRLQQEQPLSPLERVRMQRGLQQEMQRELQKHFGGRLPGRLAGVLESELSQAEASRVPWEAVLMRFVSGLKRSDYRSFPFNKKHLWRGIGLPSLGVPGPEHLVVAVDTSGSMSSQLLRQVLSEIDRIRSLSECRMTLIECDAQIQKVTEWEAWDDSTTALQRWRFRGRGGTRFHPVFEWVSERMRTGALQPDALIYLTDGYAHFPPPLPLPLLWSVPEEGLAPEAFPYGEVLVIPLPL